MVGLVLWYVGMVGVVWWLVLSHTNESLYDGRML